MSFRAWVRPFARRCFQTHRLLSSSVPQPTKVEKIILDNIKATGPISVATYMQLCLTHPTHGYYTNPLNPVFGSRGDFITSPEISQVFGELVGVWLLSQWSNAGRPSALRLVELGPGRGTLTDDVLRVMSQLTLRDRPLKHLHLVESSRAMRSVQEQKLQFNIQNLGCEVSWHDTLEELQPYPDMYTMVIAHEFFDALPIHIIQKKETGWHEVMVGSQDCVHASESDVQPTPTPYPHLRRVLSTAPSAGSSLLGFSSPRFKSLPLGSTVEVSPSAFKIARKIGELLSPGQSASSGGCALVIDYGGDKAYGDSFRAFKSHKIVDVFHKPGECDLTANVDFAYIKEAIIGLATAYGPLSQADFLDRMGLPLRVAALARSASSDQRREVIRGAAKRLVDKSGMGTQYQVLGITNGGVQTVWPFVKGDST